MLRRPQKIHKTTRPPPHARGFVLGKPPSSYILSSPALGVRLLVRLSGPSRTEADLLLNTTWSPSPHPLDDIPVICRSSHRQLTGSISHISYRISADQVLFARSPPDHCIQSNNYQYTLAFSLAYYDLRYNPRVDPISSSRPGNSSRSLVSLRVLPSLNFRITSDPKRHYKMQFGTLLLSTITLVGTLGGSVQASPIRCPDVRHPSHT